MRSLRSRLILGFAVVAVIPLAVAMLLLSRRIQDAVRAEAAERLGATLGTLQAQLSSDGERTAGKLRILGDDPQLKRLYLVRPVDRRELSDYLAEKRFLLGLDFLAVADTGGAVLADGGTAAPPPPGTDAEPWLAGLRGWREPGGPRIESRAGVPALAMAAGGPIRYQGDTVGVVRGGVVLDAAFLERLKRASGVELVLRDSSGRVVAATLSGPVGPPVPRGRGVELARVAGRSYLSRSVPLEPGAGSRAGISGLVSTAPADRTIAALRATSLLLGLLGLAIAIALGLLWSLQVSRPVERLAAFSDRIARGSLDEPLTLHSVRELETLVSALDRMREDLRTSRERLVASERQAAWSQMARMVAHEIKNPLTPIAVSVADLKRSFELGREDFHAILDQAVRTITEEVETLRRILQEFSDFARLPGPRFTPCRLSELLSGLRALYGREIEEGRLALPGPGDEAALTADPGQLRQALVNLVKNGLEATDGLGRVAVAARVEGPILHVSVADDGPGLGAEERSSLFVPNVTTKPHGSGLGLTIVHRIITDHHGSIAVESTPGRGTTFHVRIPLRQEI